MTVTTVAPLAAEPPRDRLGRYLLPIPGTGERKAHTRVTTIAGTIKDTYHLNKWRLRMAALGLGQRTDLYALAASLEAGDKQALDRLCDDAVEAGQGVSRASIGTALHGFTQRFDRGEITVAPPAPWGADLAAYRAVMDRQRVQTHPWWVERVLYHPELLIAGTCDRLVWVPGFDLPMIADLKTGDSLYMDEIALQLALYARAPYWFDPATDQHGPCPEIDQHTAMVIHLPAGTAACTLHLVDVAAGWEAVQLALAVRGWRKRKDIARPFTEEPA